MHRSPFWWRQYSERPHPEVMGRFLLFDWQLFFFLSFFFHSLRFYTPLHICSPNLVKYIYAEIFALMMSFNVTASAANLLIPSRSFSTAIWSSLKSKRNSASSLMYAFLLISRVAAPEASSFLGTLAVEFKRSSRRLGCFEGRRQSLLLPKPGIVPGAEVPGNRKSLTEMVR